jgi:hypothetical protein
MNRTRGITPSRAEIRERARRSDEIATTQCGTLLKQDVYDPMKDRAYRAMVERIDVNKTYLTGKK